MERVPLRTADSSADTHAGGDGFPAVIRHGAVALAATVAGREPLVAESYGLALENGALPEELAEVARMAHLFGGFPRAIQGLLLLHGQLKKRGLERAPSAASEPRDRRVDRQRGLELFREIYGDLTDQVLGNLDTALPGFSNWILEHAYGRVFSRPQLDACSRELMAVAALVVLRCPAQLVSHTRGARRLGARIEQIQGILTLLAPHFEADCLQLAQRTMQPFLHESDS